MIADLVMPLDSLLTPDDVVRELRRLPSAPKVLPRLKRLLCDGNSSMHDIVALIRLDPGIVARVLQVANSAYFSKGQRCITLDEAVRRVGYDQIYELVSYAVASQVLERPLEVYGVESDDLWRMSVSGALSAELLAELTGQDCNVAYTVGLLHCVGMVAIDEWALRNARNLRFLIGSFPKEATEAERAKLGFTQAEVGGTLLDQWGFPSSIVDPVRRQYAPRTSANQQRMATLLFAAKWLRNAVCGVRPVLPASAQLQPLGISPARLASLVEVVEKQLSEVSSLLDDGSSGMPQKLVFPAQIWAS